MILWSKFHRARKAKSSTCIVTLRFATLKLSRRTPATLWPLRDSWFWRQTRETRPRWRQRPSIRATCRRVFWPVPCTRRRLRCPVEAARVTAPPPAQRQPTRVYTAPWANLRVLLCRQVNSRPKLAEPDATWLLSERLFASLKVHSIYNLLIYVYKI